MIQCLVPPPDGLHASFHWRLTSFNSAAGRYSFYARVKAITQLREPLIGPSMMQGAAIRSQRNAVRDSAF